MTETVKRKRILITGSKGQLGLHLMDKLSGKHEVYGQSRADFDITDLEMTKRKISDINPDLIINTAAWTDVDTCESDPEKAWKVNCEGAGNVARAAKEIGARLFHFSSDYVFSGNQEGQPRPYRESDLTGPINIYGKSKLAGENEIADILHNYLIIRISWLYSNLKIKKNNFLLYMLRLGKQQISLEKSGQTFQALHVVNDQVGSPTWTKDVANQTELLIDSDLTGVIHSAAEGEVSRFDLVKTMFQLLEMEIKIQPCSSQEYISEALRPRYTPMDNYRLKDAGLNQMPHWKKSLSEFLQEQLRKSIL